MALPTHRTDDKEQRLFGSTNTSGAPSIAISMPPLPSTHKEHHREHGPFVRDAIIGFADGLTVPFALTAGLSVVGSSKLVVVGGLAELFAGSISMGLGAWLATSTEREHYDVEEKRERREVREVPHREEEEIYEIFGKYNLSREAIAPLVSQLKTDEDMWVQFMMDFELKLDRPNLMSAWISAGVMGSSYFIGGLIPMIPYFIFHKDVTHALFISIGITVLVLLVFGYVKAVVTGTTRRAACMSAVQTLVVGALAAATSYGIVRGVNSKFGLSANM